ncbi:AraC family transcriptional regulator [Streptomyces lavendulae]|uniref:AraC family transcriptional regulator n=1 Tax=Streptomyces lavendulae TaxID=1914 RepID=UPI0036B75C6F
MTATPTVSNAYARTLLALASSRSASVVPAAEGGRADLMRGLVSEAQLSEPGGRVSAEVMRSLWERAVALCGDRLLGLDMARAVRPGSLRAVGLLAVHAATLGDALMYLIRYQRLVSEAGVVSARSDPNGDMRIRYGARPGGGELLPQQVDAVLGAMVVQAGWLRDRPLTPAAVGLRHPPQGHRAAYAELFGVMPRFGTAADELRVSARDLAKPLPSADAELCGLHGELADRLLAALSGSGTAGAFAARWISRRPAAAARLDDLAAAMGTSARSLQRRLKEEGTSWQRVVDDARREQLIAVLARPCSLEEAARRLGYHDASSLTRAARRWFGTTPGQWRASRTAMPGPAAPADGPGGFGSPSAG